MGRGGKEDEGEEWKGFVCGGGPFMGVIKCLPGERS